MRTTEEIKADMKEIKSCLPKNYTNTDMLEVEYELREALIYDIPTDRLEEICDAERDGRCVDAQELYNRFKVAEFDKLFLEIEDYAEGYNKAIRDVTCFLLWEYGVKPLSKEQAEQALKGGTDE